MTRSSSVRMLVAWLAVTILSSHLTTAQDKVTVDAAYTTEAGFVLISGTEGVQVDTMDCGNIEIDYLDIGNKIKVRAAWNPSPDKNVINIYGKKFGQEFNPEEGKGKKIKYDSGSFLEKGPDAAGQKDGTVYFFKGCEMAVRKDAGSFGKPEDVQKHGLPCAPDAAWSEGKSLVILKGDKIWRWTGDSVSGPCPFSDTYNITSWALNPSKEDSPVSTCPDGWTLSCPSNKCYKVFSDDHDRKGHFMANMGCMQKAGKLATIRNQGEQDTLEALVGKARDNYFIGLDYSKKDGFFAWTGDKEEPTYTHWLEDEPADPKEKKFCGAFYGKEASDDFGWASVDCKSNQKYICETTASKPKPKK